MKRILKKEITLGITLVLIILTALGSFAGAFAVFHVSSKPSSFYQVDSTPSHFNVTAVTISAQGFSQITVSVSIQNLDPLSAHSTNITVSLVGANQNFLAQDWSLTGSIAALGKATEQFSFSQANILSNYSSSVIALSDTS